MVFPWYLFSTRSHIDYQDDIKSAVYDMTSPKYSHVKRVESLVFERPDGYEAYIEPGSLQVGDFSKPENTTVVETKMRPRTKVERWVVLFDDTYEDIDNPFTGEHSHRLISSLEVHRWPEDDFYNVPNLTRLMHERP